MTQRVVYTDDPDATWTFTVTSKDETEIDWATPMVAIRSGAYQAATWVGPAGTTRQVRVSFAGVTAGRGANVYLQVPNGTDLLLGTVDVKERK